MKLIRTDLEEDKEQCPPKQRKVKTKEKDAEEFLKNVQNREDKEQLGKLKKRVDKL